MKKNLHFGNCQSLLAVLFFLLISTTASYAQTFEAENLTISAKSSDTHRTLTDANCSAGATAMFDSNAAGDFVTYQASVSQAGDYTIKLRLKNHPSRGKFQLAIAQQAGGAFTNCGPVQDSYSASPSYPQVTIGNFTFATTGTKQFRFTIAPKSSASSGHTLAVDAIILTPIAPPGNGEISTSVSELIFSGVINTTTASQTISINNNGTGSLTVTALSLTGTNAGAFTLVTPPSMPLTINPGQSSPVRVAFKPGILVGSLQGILRISSNDSDEPVADVGVYGLSAKGEQGSNEPPLHNCAQTLGYNINVGGTGLILPTSPSPIGDEVLVPMFQKAGTGVVTLKPVARYSPDDLLPYGYYTLSSSGSPVHQQVATVDLNYEQSLNPKIVSGGSLSFDPGIATFGLWAGATSYAGQNTYTQDNLNTGPLDHSVRIYPLKDRTGAPIENSYLVCMEPASNGDYQDYVFTISNVKPPQSTVATPTFSPAPGTYSTTQNVSLSSTSGATIYYTTDGTTPNTSSPVYSAPIPVSSTTTIKAFATKEGMNDSGIASGTFTISAVSTQTLEAENAFLSSGVVIGNSNGGFTGTGYVDYTTASGSFIEWTVSVASTANYTVEFRYALASGSRPLSLSVNGTVVVASRSFAVTGSWTSWATTTNTVALNAGDNLIRFTTIGSSGGNFDHLKVTSQSSASIIEGAGTQSFRSESISTYPMPARNVLNIKTDDYTDQLQLINSRGEIVTPSYKKNSQGELEMNVSDLKAGSYIMTFRSGKRIIRKHVHIVK